MIDANTVLTIVGIVLAGLTALLGSKWQNAETKASNILQDLNNIVISAKDNVVTEAEFQKLVDDIKAKL